MMLNLEFIERRRPRWPVLAAVACLLAWDGALLWQWQQARAAAQQGQERVAALQRALASRQQGLDALRRPAPADAERRQESELIVQALAYPWNRVLAPLEQTQVPGVAVLSVLHERARGRTELVVEAIDAAALMRYVAALNGGQEDEGAAPAWYLSGYQVLPQATPATVRGTILGGGLAP